MQEIVCVECGFAAKLPEGYSHPTVQCPKCKKIYQLADLVLGAVVPTVPPKPPASHGGSREALSGNTVERLPFDGGGGGSADTTEAEELADKAERLRKRLSLSCQDLGRWTIASGAFCIAFTACVFTFILADETKPRSVNEEADMMLGKLLRGLAGLITAAFGFAFVWLGLRLIRQDGYKTRPRTLRAIGTFDTILLLVGIAASFMNRVAKITQPFRVGDPQPPRPIDGPLFTVLLMAFMLGWAVVSLMTWMKSNRVAELSSEYRRAEKNTRMRPRAARSTR